MFFTSRSVRRSEPESHADVYPTGTDRRTRQPSTPTTGKTRHRLRRCTLLFALLVTLGAQPLGAQQVLDEVVARVGDRAIFATDVKAAIGLGLVEIDGSRFPQSRALDQLIDRRLMLREVAKGVPPEIDPDDVEQEVRRLKSYAGTNLKSLMDATGVDEVLLRHVARDSLRLQSFLATRFPPIPANDSDAQRYFKEHPEAFQRNGVAMTFDQAADAARDAATVERRAARVSQWLAGLRRRTEVIRTAPAK